MGLLKYLMIVLIGVATLVGGLGSTYAQDEPPKPEEVNETSKVKTDVTADPVNPSEVDEGEEAAVKAEKADEAWKRYYKIRQSAQRQIQSGQGAIHIYQLVEEIVDEIIADMRELNPNVVSPIALRPIALTPNLDKQFGEFTEATLVTGIANHTDVTVKRCQACGALKSRIENGQWVVTLGMTSHEDLRREAARLGVKAFLTPRFSYFPGANIVSMTVEITRADDAAVLWSETYRSDASTAAILRTGDRVLTRAERVKELERKLDARPYYGHILYVGATHIPYDLGGISGASIGYRLYEKFGHDRRWMFGIGAEGFANFGANPLLGSFVGATLLYEIFEPNLNKPIYRTGPTISGFFAGQEGNSVAIEWGFDVTLQFRLGLGASAMYFNPVSFAGADLGGFGYKLRASFNW